MEDFQQVKNETGEDFNPQNLGGQEGEDIKFDENINIEDIQKILQQHMEEATLAENNGEIDEELPEEVPEETEINQEEPIEDEETNSLVQITENAEITETPEIDPNAKKYVIYINSENIEFIEKLSINERKLVINKILREQDELIAKKKREEEINKFIRHAIVAAFTVIIGLPLLYILVNKSLEVTIANYKESQRNFATLYREQGKIKQSNPNVMEKIKY